MSLSCDRAGCPVRVQKVVLMRHAVAQHNMPGSDIKSPALFDPPLLAQGKIEAVQAGERVRAWWRDHTRNDGVDLIVVSPLTRCIQTATLAFLPGDDYNSLKAPEMVCAEDVREACGIHYPDKQRQKSLLQVGSYINGAQLLYESSDSSLLSPETLEACVV